MFAWAITFWLCLRIVKQCSTLFHLLAKDITLSLNPENTCLTMCLNVVATLSAYFRTCSRPFSLDCLRTYLFYRVLRMRFWHIVGMFLTLCSRISTHVRPPFHVLAWGIIFSLNPEEMSTTLCLNPIDTVWMCLTFFLRILTHVRLPAKLPFH